MTVDVRPYPNYVSYIAGGFAILFSIVGCIGNVLLIIAFFKNVKLREKPTIIFILNLSVSDLMFSIVNLPILAGLFLSDYCLGNDLLCKISPVFYYGNVNVSLFSMEAIAINRCILILSPKIYKKIYTSCKVCIILVVLWVLSFLPLLLPILEIWGSLGLESKTLMCDILPKNDTTPKTVFLLTLGFVLPCLVMSISYLSIYIKIKNNHRKIKIHSKLQTLNFAKTTDSSESRAKKSILTVICCFLICFFPPVLLGIFDSNYQYPIFRLFDTIFFWASVVINPFIYSFTNRHCRNAIKNMFFTNVTINDSNIKKNSKVIGSILPQNTNTNC